jgi:hypothetical protein
MYENNRFEQEIRKCVTLEWQHVVNEIRLEPGIFVQPPEVVRSYTADALNCVTVRLEASVLGKNRPDKKVTASKTVFFEFPASPFQHWKLKHKDSWWLKWFVRNNPVIIAQNARECFLEASWSMADVYPSQTIAEPRLNEPYVMINDPISRVWERPHE